MGNSAGIQMNENKLLKDKEHKKCMTFSFELYKRVVQFLSLNDILSFGATCKLYHQFQQQYQSQFAFLYYNEFLNEQLMMILEISYPDIDYRNQVRQIVFSQTQYNWLQLYKKMTLLKQNSKMPFNFCECTYPKPVLRRETVGMYAETDYQAMLSQRLELEQKGFDKLFDAQIITEKFMKYLKDNKSLIIDQSIMYLQQHEESKSIFFKKRWMIDDYICQFSMSELQFEQQEQVEILELLGQFYQNLEIYLEGVQQYLQQFAKIQPINAIDNLIEYVFYWQAYSNAILELQTIIIPFEEIINEVYKAIFPEYPQFPKFSIWRIATKYWLQIIINQNEDYRQILEECFLKLIKHSRQQILNKQFELKDSNHQQNLYITHELYSNFTKKQKMSIFVMYNIETSHKCYQTVEELLGNVLKAFQDISLNEVCVHWVGHTELKYEECYDQLSRRILEESSYFYDEQKSIFENDLEQFINYLQLDIKFLQQFLPEPLLFEVHKLQKEHIFSTISFYISNRYISNFISNSEEQIIHIYNTISKQSRGSIASSQDNGHLDTQGDHNLNDVQKLFTFALDNINADLEELILNEKMKYEPEPIIDIIKVSLLDFQLEIDMIINSDQIKPPAQIVRSFSQKKCSQYDNVEFPDELIKQIQLFLTTFNEFNKLNSALMNYCRNYDKLLLKYYQRDQEIKIINDEREYYLNIYKSSILYQNQSHQNRQNLIRLMNQQMNQRKKLKCPVYPNLPPNTIKIRQSCHRKSISAKLKMINQKKRQIVVNLKMIAIIDFYQYYTTNMLASIIDEQVLNDSNISDKSQRLEVRELTWADFQGEPDETVPALATTKWRIGYNYQVISQEDNKFSLTVDVWCKIDPSSWVKHKFIELLKHQQGHFYIGMICALEFKKRVQEKEFSDNYKQEIVALFTETLNEHLEMEKTYDIETLNMLNTAKQKEWDIKIIKLLNQLQKYA